MQLWEILYISMIIPCVCILFAAIQGETYKIRGEIITFAPVVVLSGLGILFALTPIGLAILVSLNMLLYEIAPKGASIIIISFYFFSFFAIIRSFFGKR